MPTRAFSLVPFFMFAVLVACSKSPDESNQNAPNHQSAYDSFAKGRAALTASREKFVRAGKLLNESNQLRKTTLTLQAQARKAEEPEQQLSYRQKAQALNEKREKLHHQGKTLRNEEKEALKQAQLFFKQGLLNVWDDEIQSYRHMTLLSEEAINFAHNTKHRSVHPKMLNKDVGGSKEYQPQDDAEAATLIPPSAKSQNPPEGLDIGSFQLSAHYQYFGHIESYANSDHGSDLENAKGINAVPLSEIHQWRLFISDLHGQPLENAEIVIEGHMPGHVHGLPTAPRVTKELKPGIYLVEGMKFQMAGWWVIQFKLQKENAAEDTITFNVTL